VAATATCSDRQGLDHLYSGVDQSLLHFDRASHVERRHSVVVRRVEVGPAMDEQPDKPELPTVDGPA
jgi:hypothetical protein